MGLKSSVMTIRDACYFRCCRTVGGTLFMFLLYQVSLLSLDLKQSFLAQI